MGAKIKLGQGGRLKLGENEWQVKETVSKKKTDRTNEPYKVVP